MSTSFCLSCRISTAPRFLAGIDAFGLEAGQFFPAFADDLGVHWRLLHEVAAALHLGRGNKRAPATPERFEDQIAALGEHLDVRDEDFGRLRPEDDALAGVLLVGRPELDEVGRAVLFALLVLFPVRFA